MWIAHHFFPKIYPPCVKPTNRPVASSFSSPKKLPEEVFALEAKSSGSLEAKKWWFDMSWTDVLQLLEWTISRQTNHTNKGPLKKQAQAVLIFNDSFHSTIFVIRCVLCVFICHQNLVCSILFTITLISKPRHLQPFANLLQDLCWNDLLMTKSQVPIVVWNRKVHQVEEWIKASWVVGLSWRAKCKQHQKLYLGKTDHESETLNRLWNFLEFKGIWNHCTFDGKQATILARPLNNAPGITIIAISMQTLWSKNCSVNLGPRPI